MHVITYDAYKLGHLHIGARYHVWCLQTRTSPHVSHVEMSWFVSIVRDNVHQTFSNFYHILHIRYHDISTSFMIFGLRLHFIEFKKQFVRKFVVMFREQDFRNFGSVPGYGLTLHSIPWISFFESLNSIIRCTGSSNLYFPKKSIKWNKLTKYSKQFGKCTKFRHGVPSTVRGLLSGT